MLTVTKTEISVDVHTKLMLFACSVLQSMGIGRIESKLSKNVSWYFVKRPTTDDAIKHALALFGVHDNSQPSVSCYISFISQTISEVDNNSFLHELDRGPMDLQQVTNLANSIKLTTSFSNSQESMDDLSSEDRIEPCASQATSLSDEGDSNIHEQAQQSGNGFGV